jgi:hypothetical protein
MQSGETVIRRVEAGGWKVPARRQVNLAVEDIGGRNNSGVWHACYRATIFLKSGPRADREISYERPRGRVVRG